jgi:hypothetical protein
VENTLKEYSKRNAGQQRLKRAWWGCRSKEHAYAKGKEIVCPNKDKPSTAEAAAKNLQAYCKWHSSKKERKAVIMNLNGTTNHANSFLARLSPNQIKSLSAQQLSV